MDATANQKKFISIIEIELNKKFLGQSKEDAKQFISENIDEFQQAQQLSQMSNWNLNYL